MASYGRAKSPQWLFLAAFPKDLAKIFSLLEILKSKVLHLSFKTLLGPSYDQAANDRLCRSSNGIQQIQYAMRVPTHNIPH